MKQAQKIQHILALKISSILIVLLCICFLVIFFLTQRSWIYREKIELKNVKIHVENTIVYDTITQKYTHNGDIIEQGEKEFLFFERGIEIYELSGESYFMIQYLTQYKERYNIFVFEDVSHYLLFEKYLSMVLISLFVLFVFVSYISAIKISHLSLKPLLESNNILNNFNRYISHELKTPLSIIRSNLELFPLTHNNTLIDSSLEEIENMDTLISSLLLLGRKDFIIHKQEALSVHDISQEIFQKYQELYQDKNISYDIIAKQELNLGFEPLLLYMLFKNIIENAYKYSLENTKILLILRDKELTLTNTGENKTNIEHGIGLFIIKKICDMYSADMNLLQRNGEYTLTIKFK